MTFDEVKLCDVVGMHNFFSYMNVVMLMKTIYCYWFDNLWQKKVHYQIEIFEFFVIYVSVDFNLDINKTISVIVKKSIHMKIIFIIL